MADLDKVVNDCPAPDPRLSDGGTIHARARLDLHVVLDHDAPSLEDLLVRSVGSASEAESI